MAVVTIVVSDQGDSLDIRAEFDPPANGDEPNTPAQETGKLILQALAEAADWDVAEAIHEPAV